MTPEEMLAQAGKFFVPQPTTLNMRGVKPVCHECGVKVNLKKIRDSIVFEVNGRQYVAALCRKCTASLDAASYQETWRRLTAMKAKVSS